MSKAVHSFFADITPDPTVVLTNSSAPSLRNCLRNAVVSLIEHMSSATLNPPSNNKKKSPVRVEKWRVEFTYILPIVRDLASRRERQRRGILTPMHPHHSRLRQPH